MLDNLLLDTNWNAINSISNFVIAIMAFLSLGLNFYLLYHDKKQKKEDKRARIYCSIVKEEYGYYLLVENVGKEVAYDIHFKVYGTPIENNLYEFVKKVFFDIENDRFILKPNDKKYFYLAPPIMQDHLFLTLPWKERFSNEQINNWLHKYDKDDIFIRVRYNKNYKIKYKFSIRDFNVIGTFQIPEPIAKISKSLTEIKRYIKESEKELHNIAEKIKKNK